jgi:isopenicillin-N N-acyltransferase like protein
VIRAARRLAGGALVLAVACAAPRMAPSRPDAAPVGADGIARHGASYARVREGVREVYLAGGPEEIGRSMSALLYDPMVANERGLRDDFARLVPFAPARALIVALGRFRYRDVGDALPEARRREIAAQAAGFSPDPFTGWLLPTYRRMVLLHALYDIALGFEGSPLVGCTAFALGPGAVADGHVLFARAFDFEANEGLDRDKAVYFVREDGAIPFASVAWPGFVGVLTGVNLAGVAVEVNGARAGTPAADGEPVPVTLREVLARAHDVDEAVAVLAARRPMASHLVLVADAAGGVAVVERVPGRDAFVRRRWPDPDRVGVTNHLEGPSTGDPKNVRVRAETTTLARRARLDALLAGVGAHEADVPRAVAMLRDHACAGDDACPLGDRRAIDALIARHGMVADLTERTIWVSAGPHLSGKFVAFDLRTIFAAGHDPAADPAPRVIGEDPILLDDRYAAGVARSLASRDRP